MKRFICKCLLALSFSFLCLSLASSTDVKAVTLSYSFGENLGNYQFSTGTTFKPSATPLQTPVHFTDYLTEQVYSLKYPFVFIGHPDGHFDGYEYLNSHNLHLIFADNIDKYSNVYADLAGSVGLLTNNDVFTGLAKFCGWATPSYVSDPLPSLFNNTGLPLFTDITRALHYSETGQGIEYSYGYFPTHGTTISSPQGSFLTDSNGDFTHTFQITNNTNNYWVHIKFRWHTPSAITLRGVSGSTKVSIEPSAWVSSDIVDITSSSGQKNNTIYCDNYDRWLPSVSVSFSQYNSNGKSVSLYNSLASHIDSMMDEPNYFLNIPELFICFSDDNGNYSAWSQFYIDIQSDSLVGNVGSASFGSNGSTQYAYENELTSSDINDFSSQEYSSNYNPSATVVNSNTGTIIPSEDFSSLGTQAYNSLRGLISSTSGFVGLLADALSFAPPWFVSLLWAIPSLIIIALLVKLFL